jgi:AraC-like DNA-binding protein
MIPYIVKDIQHFCNVSVNKCTKIKSHVITYYDLTFVLKGELTYLANGKTYLLQKDDAILLPPGTLRERLEGTEKVEYGSFNFQVFSDDALPQEIFLKNVITRDIRSLLSLFSQRHLSPAYHSKEKLCNLLNYILFEIADSSAMGSNHSHVINIEKFIEENLSRQITLTMISNHLHLSKEYIAYIFKKEVGKTIVEYTNERKMLIAKNMIQTGELSLPSIAEHLGFESYSYFSRVFKKHFKVSPGGFKAQKENLT